MRRHRNSGRRADSGRPVTQADVPAVARVLARAFATNPGMSWVFRDPAARPDRLERLFDLLLTRVWVPRGECLTTNDLDGAALWLGPGRWHRGQAPQHAGHWYLAVLGVDPSSQGRGFAPHLNVALYERHGFRVTGQLTLPGGAEPTVWLMWRDPAG